MKNKIKIKRQRKAFSVYGILCVLIIILVTMSMGYSRFSKELKITGTVTGIAREPDLPAEIVVPSNPAGGGTDRLSTNTSIKAGLFNVNYLSTINDVREDQNTITTRLRNATNTIFKDTAEGTFTLTIQNNSGYTWTNGTKTTENNNLSQYASLTSSSLSKTTVESGQTVTLTMTVNFSDTRRDITVGQYFMIKMAFQCNGLTKYYNYKVLIAS